MSSPREYMKRTYTMRLDDKPYGFFQALNDFIKQDRRWNDRRLQLELGAPDITTCDSEMGWFRRMTDVVEDNVCASVLDVRWDGRTDSIVYFDVVIAGPKADQVEKDPYGFVVFPRMMGEHSHSNSVAKITGFDLVKSSRTDRGLSTQSNPNEHIKPFFTVMSEKGALSEALVDLIRLKPFVMFTPPSPGPTTGPFPSTVRTIPDAWDKRLPGAKVVLTFNIPIVYEGTVAPKDSVKLSEQSDEPGRLTQWDVSIPVAKLSNRLKELIIHCRSLASAEQLAQQHLLAEVALHHEISDITISSWALTEAYLDDARISHVDDHLRIVLHLIGNVTPIT